MSVDKETARTKLYDLDPCIHSLKQSKIYLEKKATKTFSELHSNIENEPFFEVRGGIGNNLIVYQTLEDRIMNQMSRSLSDIILSDIDYLDPSTFPKEWNNIQKGKDTMKLNKKETVYFWVIVTGIISLLASGITFLTTIFI